MGVKGWFIILILIAVGGGVLRQHVSEEVGSLRMLINIIYAVAIALVLIKIVSISRKRETQRRGSNHEGA